MTTAETFLSRFTEKRTSSTFTGSLSESRLGYASRTHSRAEVAYKRGFNDIANFNRLFKKPKNYTPDDFRQSFSGTKAFSWARHLIPCTTAQPDDIYTGEEIARYSAFYTFNLLFIF